MHTRSRPRAAVLARAGTLIPLLALAACDVRARPALFAPEIRSLLEVEVLSPTTESNSTVLAGRRLDVAVHANDAGGQLVGIGVVVRRPGQVTIDSTVVDLSGVRDVIRGFSIEIPADLATNTQLQVTGLAFAAGGAVQVSEPQVVIVLHCTEQSAFCP